jgi:hypothetical protein
VEKAEERRGLIVAVMEDVDVGCGGGEGARGWWSDRRRKRWLSVRAQVTVTVVVRTVDERWIQEEG